MKTGGGGGLKAELNVTPLVDVVLVLLIIFMVVTPFMHKGPKVDLPKAASSEPAKTKPVPIIVTVTATKTLLLGEADVLEADLPKVLERVLKASPDAEVYVQGDKSLHFGDVKRILDICHKAGATKLSLATSQLKEG